MQYKNKLIPGKLIKRYKRFLTDVELSTGEIVVAHCTNTGAMTSCIEEGASVMLSPADDPKRKTKFTWEMIYINAHWIGINTMIPNRFAFEAVQQNIIPGLKGYTKIQAEVKYDDSRFDLKLERKEETCFVEIKNVTLNDHGIARFPDAISTRGLKHLNTLIKVKQEGMRAVMLYIIQRMDVDSFAPAAHIDPAYAEGLKRAYANGVEIIPAQVKVSPEGIEFNRILPFNL